MKNMILMAAIFTANVALADNCPSGETKMIYNNTEVGCVNVKANSVTAISGAQIDTIKFYPEGDKEGPTKPPQTAICNSNLDKGGAANKSGTPACTQPKTVLGDVAKLESLSASAEISTNFVLAGAAERVRFVITAAKLSGPSIEGSVKVKTPAPAK